jgi:hypothetical protein
MAEGAYGYGKLGIARFYALVFGIAYLAVGLLELFYKTDDPLKIGDTILIAGATVHIIIHLAVGILVLGSFFAGESAAKSVARVVGVVFLIVFALNLFASNFYAELVGFPDGSKTPIVYTIVHAITAAGALYAGFSAGRGYRSAAAA